VQQRLLSEQLAGARAFEQAEASLIEGVALLRRTCPSRVRHACRRVFRRRTGPPWQATDSGYVFLQNLGESIKAAGMPAGEQVTLVRVTAVSHQVRGRRALEAVYALDGAAVGGASAGANAWRTTDMQRGLSLIELLIVMALIGMLAAIAYPSYSEQLRRAARSEVVGLLQDAALRLARHHTRVGGYADNEQLVTPLPMGNRYYRRRHAARATASRCWPCACPTG
jgi:type IV pilus assembly protein PilE